MLALTGVDAFYGRAQALCGVSLTVGAGEAVALLGRNGAGKSTLLKTIIGLTPPSAVLAQLDMLSALEGDEE